MKAIIGSVCLTVLMSNAVTARPIADESGWEFTLSLNTGYVSGQSNLSTADGNEVLSDLNSKASATDSVIVFPFARVQYTTEDLKTQLFLGNSREQISTSQFQYELGIIHQFADNSKLTAAYFPELPLFNETWEDPFLVEQDRTKTDENIQGGRIQLERIAGGPFTFKYAYARSQVDNDKSGQSSYGLSQLQRQTLQRNSQYHRVAVETMFPVSSGVFLKPTLQYTARLADGDAVSYDDYNAQLALLVFKGRHTAITTINFGKTLYKAGNPIFSDKKQDSLNAGVFSVYSYAEAFNVKPLTLTLIGGYSQKDSDIAFYDESGLFVSTGFAYTF